jgi:hypothetical protein
MAGADVRDFVPHNTRELCLIVGRHDQSSVDVKETTRQREGVDLVRIDDFDRKGNLGIGVPHQGLADPVHIFIHDRIGEQFDGTLHFAGELASQLDFLFD